MALGIASLIGCDHDGAGAAPSTQPGGPAMPAMPPAAVSVVQAITRDVPVYIDEIGSCSAREFVQVRPQVAGRITEIHFQDGQELTRGQKLFTIDPRPYQAVLDQARAALAQAEATLAFARQQLENAQGAAEARAISREELQTRQNAVAVAEATIKVRQATIVAAEIDVENCTIVAPIDGRAGRRLVDVGNVVRANDDELLTIQGMDPIYADFTTNERNLESVRRESARGSLKTLVSSPQSKLPSRQGTLTFLDNTVQPGTGTIRLRATLPNEDRAFWPGQFVNVRLVLRVNQDAVLVPTAAQQVGQQGPFVYVVKEATAPDGTPATIAELRPVVPGQRHGDMLAIDQGLTPGERVVVVGHRGVMPGAPVMVMPPAGEHAAPGPQQASATTRPVGGHGAASAR